MPKDYQPFITNSPGHLYTLPHVGSPEETGSEMLQFVHKQKDPESGELELVHPGTTTEAVIKVLIDRLTFLDVEMPSVHNQEAIAALEGALKHLEDRTADRVNRGVEGTHQA